MRQTAAYLTIATLLGVLGCATSGLPPPDLSREAYLEDMHQHDDLELPRMPYEDWALFQNQRVLHEIYRKQLDLDVNDFTNNAPFLIVFETWGEFQTAERQFRKRSVSAGVASAAAFETYELSDRQRRAIGQWEAKVGMFWQLYYLSLELPFPDPAIKKYFIDRESPYEEGVSISEDGSHVSTNWPDNCKPDVFYGPKYKEDYPRFKPKYVDDMQQFATEELATCRSVAGETPYSAKLKRLAAEELRNSKQAQAAGDLAGAFQWAADALVTARSATALWNMESRTNGSTPTK